MIDLTVTINNDEALRKLRQLQQTAKQTTSNIVSDADRMDMAMARLARTLGQVGAGVSLVGLVKQIGQVRSEFQQLEIAFSTMLKSEAKASALMSQLTKTAATTPFGLQDVANGAKQLLAYGTSAEKVNETLIRLGDIAAGLSIPLGDLVYLFGTTQTQGRLYTQDFNQFLNRGIPLAEELAKMFDKDKSEIKKMVTEGKIGFPEVERAIISMTSAGGKFGGLMEAQSKTIGGLVSNLEDAFDMMFNEIGKDTEGIFVSSLQTAIKLVENYEKVLDVLIPIISAYGTYKAALIMVAAAQKSLLAVDAAKTFITMARSIGVANAAMKSLNLTMAASPWALLASLVVGAGVAVYKFSQNSNSAEKATKALHDSINGEVSTLDTYFGALKNAEKGTKEYKDAIVEINSKYGSYFENQLTEKSNADEIAAAYDRVKNSIMGAAMERARSAYLEEPTEDLAKSETKAMKRLQDSGFVRQMNDLGRGAWTRNVEKLISDIKKGGGEMPLDEVKNRLAEITKSARQLSGLSFTAENEKYYKIGLGGVPLEKLLEDAKAMADAEKAFKDFSAGYTMDDKKTEDKKPKGKVLTEEEKDKLKKSAKDAQKEITQAEVDAMAEGTPKVLAQIESDYKKREAEIKKWEDDIKKIRGGKLTDEEASAAATMRRQNERNRTDARMAALYTDMPSHGDLASQFEAELDALDEYAIKYGTYYEKILATKDKYSRQIAEADTAGEKMMLEEEMNAALVELEMEGLQYYEHIKGLTDEVLKNALSEMEGLLSEAEDKIAESPDMSAEDTKALKAQIAVYKAKIAALQNERDARGEDNGDSYKDWAKRSEVIRDLADEFKQLGKEIGGVAGKAISAAGEVGTGVVSMIDGIKQLGEMSVKSVESSAEGASKAIQMVEKASVILAIVGAAIKVTKTLYSLFAKGADYSDYEALKAKYEDLNEVWDQLLDKKKEYIEMSYGAEADKVGEEAIDIIKKQIESYKELGKARLKSGASAGSHSIGVRQMNRLTKSDKQDVRDAAAEYGFDANKVLSGRMTELFNLTTEQLIGLRDNAQSFWAKLDDDVREYLNNIIEAEERIKEINDSVAEQLTQISFDSLYDSFVDSLMDMDKSAKDFSEDFSKYMMKAMLATAVGNTYRKQLEDWYQSFAKANNDEEGITPEERAELRKNWDSIAQSAIELRDTLADATGYGDTVDAQQASARGFQAMSQEVGNELNGRFTDIQGKITDMRAQGEERLVMSRRQLEEIAYIRSVIDRGVNYAQDTRDVLLNISGDVSEIRMLAETLPRIHEAISKTNRILDNKL